MTHLGELGVEHEPVEVTFSYFGEIIRTNPNLTDLTAYETFGAVQEAKTNSDAVQALRRVLAVLIHSDDVERCWALALANRQTLEDMADLSFKLLEAATARPTERPSDSSAGPSSTATRSTDDVFSRALRAEEGRPDRQVAVLRAAN